MGKDQETHEALRAEIARLEARVAELERLRDERPPRDGDGPHDGLRVRGEDIPYEALFNALPIPIVLYTPDGTVVALNDYSLQHLATTRERIVGKYNVFEDPNAAAEGYPAHFQRALAGEVSRMPPTAYDTIEGPMFPGKGQRLWAEPTYLPIRDASGAVRFILLVSIDITASKRAEAEQRRSAALLEVVIDNAPLLIYARDTEGRFTIVNAKTARFLNGDRDAMLGKSIHDLLPQDVADMFQAQDLETMKSKIPVTIEDHVPEPDGPHVYITTKFALRDEEGRATGVCGVSMDITERVRAEETSRRLQEELLRVQEETIRAISTPLLPIAEGVLVMPLVGEVTRERAAQVIETLLAGVSSQQARIVILDVTGVPQAAGMAVTDAVFRAARSVRLLGAEIVLTGIRPSVAQALVEMDADLGGIVTLSTLERGVAYALAARGASAARAPARRATR